LLTKKTIICSIAKARNSNTIRTNEMISGGARSVRNPFLTVSTAISFVTQDSLHDNFYQRCIFSFLVLFCGLSSLTRLERKGWDVIRGCLSQIVWRKRDRLQFICISDGMICLCPNGTRIDNIDIIDNLIYIRSYVRYISVIFPLYEYKYWFRSIAY